MLKDNQNYKAKATGRHTFKEGETVKYSGESMNLGGIIFYKCTSVESGRSQFVSVDDLYLNGRIKATNEPDQPAMYSEEWFKNYIENQLTKEHRKQEALPRIFFALASIIVDFFPDKQEASETLYDLTQAVEKKSKELEKTSHIS